MDNYQLFYKILNNWKVWSVFCVYIFVATHIYFLSGNERCFAQRRYFSKETRNQDGKLWSYNIGKQIDEKMIPDCGFEDYKYSSHIVIFSIVVFVIFCLQFYKFMADSKILKKLELEFNSNKMVKSIDSFIKILFTLAFYSALMIMSFTYTKVEKAIFGWIFLVLLCVYIIIKVYYYLTAIKKSRINMPIQQDNNISVQQDNNISVQQDNNIYLILLTLFTLLPVFMLFVFVIYISYYVVFYSYTTEANELKMTTGGIIPMFIAFCIFYTMYMISGFDKFEKKNENNNYENILEKMGLSEKLERLALPFGLFITLSLLAAIYNFAKYPNNNKIALRSFSWIMLLLNIVGIGMYMDNKLDTFGIFFYYGVLLLITVGMVLYFRKNKK